MGLGDSLWKIVAETLAEALRLPPSQHRTERLCQQYPLQHQSDRQKPKQTKPRERPPYQPPAQQRQEEQIGLYESLHRTALPPERIMVVYERVREAVSTLPSVNGQPSLEKIIRSINRELSREENQGREEGKVIISGTATIKYMDAFFKIQDNRMTSLDVKKQEVRAGVGKLRDRIAWSIGLALAEVELLREWDRLPIEKRIDDTPRNRYLTELGMNYLKERGLADY